MDVNERLRTILEGTAGRPALLQEAYYGKNPILIQCEKLMEEAVQGGGGNTQLEKVSDILQDLFGFKDLAIIPSIFTPFASTLPLTTFKLKYAFNRLEMARSDTGLSFKPEDKVQAVIFINLNDFYLSKLTGEEMIATILHEIGHSMKMILPSAQLGNAVASIGFCSTVLPALMFNFKSDSIVAGYKSVGKITDKFAKIVSGNDPGVQAGLHLAYKIYKFLNIRVDQLRDTVTKLKGSGPFGFVKNQALSGVKTALGIGLKTATRRRFKLIQFIRQFFTFKEELLSDFISTAYGYGPSLISAIGKLENQSNRSTLSNPLTRLITLPFNLTNLAFNPHPKNISRMKQVIAELEMELHKSINKKAYSMIQEDIDQAKTQLDAYQESMNRHKLLNFDILIYRKVMGKLMDGNDDVRVLFFGLKPKDLEMIDDLEPLPVNPKEPETLQECYELLQEAADYPREVRQACIDFITEN